MQSRTLFYETLCELKFPEVIEEVLKLKMQSLKQNIQEEEIDVYIDKNLILDLQLLQILSSCFLIIPSKLLTK